MRAVVKVALASLAVVAIAGVVAACSDAGATESRDPELQRDLELASATTMNLALPPVDSAILTSLEVPPLSATERARVARPGSERRAPRGSPGTGASDAARSPGAGEDAAEEVAQSTVPETSEPAAVLPLPTPAPAGGVAEDYGTGGGIFGDGSDRGRGGVGVVIRGGGVDGDNCELHRRRPRPARGPIYVPAEPVTQPVPRTSPPTRDPLGTRGRPTGTRRPERVAGAPTPPAEPSDRRFPTGPRTRREF